jgi:hypothetical protein
MEFAYAFVHDVAASWHEYKRLISAASPPPGGLLLQAAGPTDEGIRIIGIWRSERDWCADGRDRHMSTVDALEGLGDPARSFRDIPTVLLLVGELVHDDSQVA